MGKVKQLWADKVDKLGDDYVTLKIDSIAFLNGMLDLGFDMGESLAYLDSLDDTKLFSREAGDIS